MRRYDDSFVVRVEWTGYSADFDLPLLLGKMAACPSSGKLEQQRGSTISFHHSPLELPSKRNKKSVDKSSQHTIVNNEAVVFVSLSPRPVADIGPR